MSFHENSINIIIIIIVIIIIVGYIVKLYW